MRRNLFIGGLLCLSCCSCAGFQRHCCDHGKSGQFADSSDVMQSDDSMSVEGSLMLATMLENKFTSGGVVWDGGPANENTLVQFSFTSTSYKGLQTADATFAFLIWAEDSANTAAQAMASAINRRYDINCFARVDGKKVEWVCPDLRTETGHSIRVTRMPNGEMTPHSLPPGEARPVNTLTIKRG